MSDIKFSFKLYLNILDLEYFLVYKLKNEIQKFDTLTCFVLYLEDYIHRVSETYYARTSIAKNIFYVIFQGDQSPRPSLDPRMNSAKIDYHHFFYKLYQNIS